jgi:acetolactate synthase-1/2/3 large subunit
VTRAVTGIASMHGAWAPVLVLSGTPPRLQENPGALLRIVHTALVRSSTRFARTGREPALAPQERDEAIARAGGRARLGYPCPSAATPPFTHPADCSRGTSAAAARQVASTQ